MSLPTLPSLPSLPSLPPEADTPTVLDCLEANGAAIIENAIDPGTVRKLTGEVMPFIDRTPMGGDDFSGKLTQRTGALVARSATCRDMVMHPLVLQAARAFLAPFTEKILLHLTQTIYINPGSERQTLHRDRLAWGTHIPSSIEPQFNTLWALTDFTTDNGATRFVPGSHKWDWGRRAAPDEIMQAQMPAGSVLIYTGSILHGGGANTSATPRLGLNLTYTLGWLRQEENQYLSCPPHIAKNLEPEMQELLGYTQGNYALGYYSDPEAAISRSDILPPESALGRKPRKGLAALTPGNITEP